MGVYPGVGGVDIVADATGEGLRVRSRALYSVMSGEVLCRTRWRRRRGTHLAGVSVQECAGGQDTGDSAVTGFCELISTAGAALWAGAASGVDPLNASTATAARPGAMYG